MPALLLINVPCGREQSSGRMLGCSDHQLQVSQACTDCNMLAVVSGGRGEFEEVGGSFRREGGVSGRSGNPCFVSRESRHLKSWLMWRFKAGGGLFHIDPTDICSGGVAAAFRRRKPPREVLSLQDHVLVQCGDLHFIIEFVWAAV